MRLFPELQRAQLRLLEQQSGSWLRGNPSFLRHKATTPPPGLPRYQVGFPSAWCSLTRHLRGIIFKNQRTHR